MIMETSLKDMKMIMKSRRVSRTYVYDQHSSYCFSGQSIGAKFIQGPMIIPYEKCRYETKYEFIKKSITVQEGQDIALECVAPTKNCKDDDDSCRSSTTKESCLS